MSDLQKAWAKKKLAPMGPDGFNELDEEQETGHVGDLPDIPDDDSSSASSASSTGTIVPSPSRNLFARPQFAPRGRSLEQVPWTTYFERELFLPEPEDAGGESITHHAYLTSPVGKGPLFVMHHGAGSSGLSFAVVGSEIRKRLPSAGILSLDARGHGSTTVAPSADASVDSSSSSTTTTTTTTTTTNSASQDPGLDLRLETLRRDLLSVIRLTKTQMHWAELPPIILVGHSLGGAVVTDLAVSGALGGALLGYAVLDVVEGSAIDALQSMQTYLSTRPKGFASLQQGIDWHVRSRTIRNSVSARTSVPALLVHDGAGGEKQGAGGVAAAAAGAPAPAPAPGGGSATSRPWHWRTDLAATEPFWKGWFVGLSKKFLEAKGGKLLLLAGTDRLDKELTIGQMQGKYALQVFPEAGHFIHEDLPEKTAHVLVDFYRRNDRTALVLPPKVSELLAQGKRV